MPKGWIGSNETVLEWTEDILESIPYDFVGGCAVLYHDNIHILGGGRPSGTKNHYVWYDSWVNIESDLPYDFYDGCAVVYNDKIHILNIKSSSTNNYLHYSWDDISGSWHFEGEMPINSEGNQAVVYDNKIHLIGESMHYSWDGTTWNDSNSDMPSGRKNAIVYQNKIHILGVSGDQGLSYRKHYSWDTSSWNWNPEPDLPIDFLNGSSVLFDGNVHILGSSISGFTNAHYYLNSSSWVREKSLNEEFNYGSAIVKNDKIHIIGGLSENNRSKNTEIYLHEVIKQKEIKRAWVSVVSGYKLQDITPEDPEWLKYSDLPYSFYGGGVVLYHDKIHILGSLVPGNEMNHYSWDGTSWTNEGELPYESFGGCAVVYNDKIHILGGSTSSVRRNHYSWDDYNNVWTAEDQIYGNLLHSPKAVVLNGKIHMIGEIRLNGEYVPRHYSFDYDNGWIKENDPPYNLYYGDVVVYDNKIHMLGGGETDPTIPYEDLHKFHYSWNGTEWNNDGNLPKSFYQNPAVVYKNKIHIFCIGVETAHYSWNGTEWAEDFTTSYYMEGASAVVRNNNIHVLGGVNNVQYLDHHSIYYYNSDGKEAVYTYSDKKVIKAWVGTENGNKLALNAKFYSDVVPISESVNLFPFNYNGNGSLLVYDNKLNLIGGETLSPAGYVNARYVWDDDDKIWYRASYLPFNQQNVGRIVSVVFNNTIHLFAMVNGSVVHYCFDKSSNTWYTQSPPPVKFKEGSKVEAIVFNDRLYLINVYDPGLGPGSSGAIYYELTGSSARWSPCQPTVFSRSGIEGYPLTVVHNDRMHMLYLTNNFNSAYPMHYSWDGDLYTPATPEDEMPYWSQGGIFGAVSFNNKIYISGGKSLSDVIYGNPDQKVIQYLYSWDENSKWKKEQDLPYGCRGWYAMEPNGMVVYKDKIYILSESRLKSTTPPAEFIQPFFTINPKYYFN